jgi:hypothetical protein
VNKCLAELVWYEEDWAIPNLRDLCWVCFSKQETTYCPEVSTYNLGSEGKSFGFIPKFLVNTATKKWVGLPLTHQPPWHETSDYFKQRRSYALVSYENLRTRKRSATDARLGIQWTCECKLVVLVELRVQVGTLIFQWRIETDNLLLNL